MRSQLYCTGTQHPGNRKDTHTYHKNMTTNVAIIDKHTCCMPLPWPLFRLRKKSLIFHGEEAGTDHWISSNFLHRLVPWSHEGSSTIVQYSDKIQIWELQGNDRQTLYIMKHKLFLSSVTFTKISLRSSLGVNHEAMASQKNMKSWTTPPGLTEIM